ncbi:MAG: DUF6516 family protein [Gemmatales bacterium]|nr:DUF6516 family protein [Gemmatales bacterium]MDW8316985.1 DUF6516 family protein [Anaerolineae bacterium]
MLASLQAYSLYIYSLAERYPSVRGSTLIVIPLGATMGSVRGTLEFDGGIVLRVVEELDFKAQRIEYYSYTVSKGEEILYWYDPQPHPNDPTLASTHPHHKHVPPDTPSPDAKRSGIKHNRVPAPGISFERPNLPFLIEEIERDLLRS